MASHLKVSTFFLILSSDLDSKHQEEIFGAKKKTPQTLGYYNPKCRFCPNQPGSKVMVPISYRQLEIILFFFWYSLFWYEYMSLPRIEVAKFYRFSNNSVNDVNGIGNTMDKNLDWKLLCFNIRKTTNAAFLLNSAPLTKK